MALKVFVKAAKGYAPVTLHAGLGEIYLVVDHLVSHSEGGLFGFTVKDSHFDHQAAIWIDVNARVVRVNGTPFAEFVKIEA